jgi:hypothetical protein
MSEVFYSVDHAFIVLAQSSLFANVISVQISRPRFAQYASTA